MAGTVHEPAEVEAEKETYTPPTVPGEALVPVTRSRPARLDETALVPTRPRRRSRRLLVRFGIPLLLLGLVLAFFLRGERPKEVTVVAPQTAVIRETIASSGRVGGVTETIVGAQASGVVQRLFVREGDHVRSGQQLATLKNDVAEAQVAQARQAVATARAQLAQVAAPPRSSDVSASAEQVAQARAQVVQQQAAVQQASKAVAQARARLRQAQAQRELDEREYRRSTQLVEQGVISQSQFDQARTRLQVSEQAVGSEQQAVELAEANLPAARAGIQAAQANVRALESKLSTVQAGATPQAVEVARQQLAEAERNLAVAVQQARNAVVNAPFDGIVTGIDAQLGQSVGAQGVLTLVSDEPEIRLDVDESNLADLSSGQDAIISSSTFPGQTFRGRVTEIGAAVDEARGTVEVTVTPVDPPEWLRPGQTVNVNIVTAEAAERLLVPATAVARSGNRSVVFTVQDDRAVEKPVVTRPPTDQGVPVLAGLEAGDLVIENAAGITPGERIRVARREGG